MESAKKLPDQTYKKWVSFWKLFQEVYDIVDKNEAQKRAAPLWDRIKQGGEEYNAEIAKLNQKRLKKKAKNASMWSGFKKSKKVHESDQQSSNSGTACVVDLTESTLGKSLLYNDELIYKN